MESSENDNAVFRPSHKPWKSLRDYPHFPRSDDYESEIISPRSHPRCPPYKGPSGSFPDWKRLFPQNKRRKKIASRGKEDGLDDTEEDIQWFLTLVGQRTQNSPFPTIHKEGGHIFDSCLAGKSPCWTASRRTLSIACCHF